MDRREATLVEVVQSQIPGGRIELEIAQEVAGSLRLDRNIVQIPGRALVVGLDSPVVEADLSRT